jgi:hypothetical protein
MSDVYKIGVSILLSDGMSAGLSAISHRLLGIHKSVKDIEGGFSKWKLAIGGAGSVFAGSMLLKGMASIANHAKDFQHELAKARALGLDVGQMTQVADQAWKNTRDVSGVDAAHAVKTIGSLYSIVGLEEALKLSPGFEKSDQVLGALGKGEQGSAYTLARAGELMGKFTDATGHLDVAKFSQFLDVINKAVIATHGMVSTKDYLNYAKQAGPASANLNEDGMLTTSVLIQAMGGHRAGTAGAALARQFAGGIMTQRVASELEKLGLANKGDFEVRRGGQVVAKPGAMSSVVEALGKDPMAAIVDHIMPALQKAGFTGDKMAAEIYRMIGTGPAQREVYEMLRGIYQIQQERERAKGAMGVQAGYDNFSKTDPLVAEKNAHVAYNNMLTAMGSSLLVAAVPTMLKITELFKDVAAFANAHPDAILNIAKGVAVLGAVFVGAGVAAIAAAIGAGGWFFVGFVALGEALLVVPWKDLWTGFAAAITGIATAIANAIAGIRAALGGGLGGPAGPVNPYTKMPGQQHGPLGPAPSGLGRQGYNAVPPTGGGGGNTRIGLNVDGRELAQVIVPHMARDANGPLRGSAYFDGTATFTPADFSYARG